MTLPLLTLTQIHCFWHLVNYEVWAKSPWEITIQIPNYGSDHSFWERKEHKSAVATRGCFISQSEFFLNGMKLQMRESAPPTPAPLLTTRKPFDSYLTLWHLLLYSFLCILSSFFQQVKLNFVSTVLRMALSHAVLRKPGWLRCRWTRLSECFAHLTGASEYNPSHPVCEFTFNKKQFFFLSFAERRNSSGKISGCHLTPMTKN